MKFIQIIAIAVLVGCDNSKMRNLSMEVETIEAASLNNVAYDFVEYGEDKQQGRFAVFKITNRSEVIIMGYRGELLGYDANGEQVYNFPWSQVALPSLIESGQSIKSNVGFEIPNNVERVEFAPEEFDLRKK